MFSCKELLNHVRSVTTDNSGVKTCCLECIISCNSWLIVVQVVLCPLMTSINIMSSYVYLWSQANDIRGMVSMCMCTLVHAQMCV